MKSNTGIFILLASVLLIVVAIIISTFTSNSAKNKKIDIRAKAEKVESMMFNGAVRSYDYDTKILIVDNLEFSDSKDNKSLGSWNITPNSTFNPAKYGPGTRIKILARPASFDVKTQSLTASEISQM